MFYVNTPDGRRWAYTDGVWSWLSGTPGEPVRCSEADQRDAPEAGEVDPFNCPKCGAHDWGLNAQRCPHCDYEAPQPALATAPSSEEGK